MKRSLNAWTVDGAADMRTTFADVKAAGFEGIELNVDAPGSSAHSISFETTDAELREIRALSEEYELPVVSISTSLWRGMAVNHSECERLMTFQLKCAKALGAKGILTVPGDGTGSVTLRGARENSLHFMKRMLPLIHGFGLKVGAENVWNGFFMSPYDMSSFIDEINDPLVCAYYDLGNVLSFARSEDWVEVLGSRIGFVHIKDYYIPEMFHTGEWRDVGEGSGHWDRIMTELKKTGYDGYVTGEVFRSDSSMSWKDYYKKVNGDITRTIALA